MWVLYGYGLLGCFPLSARARGQVDHHRCSPYMGGRARVWQGRAVVSRQVEGTTGVATRNGGRPCSSYHGAHAHAPRKRGQEQIGVQGDLGRLDLGMTDFWSVCYTVHCAHHRPSPPVQGSS